MIWKTLIVALVALAATACGPDYLRKESHYADVQGVEIDEQSEIPDTEANRAIVNVLITYRNALIQKDVGSLKRLVSDKYYENAGTTDTTKDDYGAADLNDVFELLASEAEDIKYDVIIKGVEVDGDKASVDYEFKYAYRFTVGDQQTWDAGTDLNRLELLDENGEWKIISGL
ncbi:MAG: hypothetical protein R3E66_08960 [bacterium]